MADQSKYVQTQEQLENARIERLMLYHRLATCKSTLDETARLQLKVLSVEFFGVKDSTRNRLRDTYED